MNDREAERLLELGEKYARKVLLKDRERQLDNMYHLVASDGSITLVPGTWENDIQKQIILAVVRDIAKKIKCRAVLFTGEGWTVSREVPATEWHKKREAGKWYPPPSQDPERKEVVNIIAADTLGAKALILQMVRDKPGGRLISLVETARL